MSNVGIRSGKVKAGYYKFGKYTIEKVAGWWFIFHNGEFVRSEATLADANYWCRRNDK